MKVSKQTLSKLWNNGSQAGLRTVRTDSQNLDTLAKPVTTLLAAVKVREEFQAFVHLESIKNAK